MSMIDPFGAAELRELIAWEGGPCLSIYMPTHRSGAISEDRVRFRNLVRRAEDRLEQLQLKKELSEPLEARARMLSEGTRFWSRLGEGLTLHVARGKSVLYRLSVSFPEMVSVGTAFYVKPLFSAPLEQRDFYLLALSEKSRKLYHGDAVSIAEVPVQALPEGWAKALMIDEDDRHLRWHAGHIEAAGGQGVYHVQGSSAEEAGIKRWLREYCIAIDRRLADFLKHSGAPLLLAAAEPIFSIYREINTYRHFVPHDIPLNNKHTSDEKLRREAWRVVSAHLSVRRELALRRYGELKGGERAAEGLGRVLPACMNGQVHELFIDLQRECWGRYDRENNRVELHAEPRLESRDLYDMAAAHAWQNGAAIYPIDANELSPADGVGASLRYGYDYAVPLASESLQPRA